jgi:hypothetical protein
VTNKRFGCQQVGELPNASVNPDSLINAAVRPGEPTNESFNEEQMKAALAYIKNVEPLPLSHPKEDILKTPGGASLWFIGTVTDLVQKQLVRLLDKLLKVVRE